jgi:Zn finger protein HypA/HybF involved in hydrogenase expression
MLNLNKLIRNTITNTFGVESTITKREAQCNYCVGKTSVTIVETEVTVEVHINCPNCGNTSYDVEIKK